MLKMFTFSLDEIVTIFLFPTSDPTYADNSSITFKLCLSDPKTSLGGDLTFGDTRCASHEQKDDRPLSTISLDMGHAVMHCGRHRNGVLPVDVEKKVYLIIWMKR